VGYDLKAFGAAAILGAAAFVLLILYTNASSTAKVACAVIKAAHEAREDFTRTQALEDAFAICHNNGFIRLPGD